jgi:hypothetical protein
LYSLVAVYVNGKDEVVSDSFELLLVNKKVHTKENGDVWRIVTETGESGNLDLSRKPSD